MGGAGRHVQLINWDFLHDPLFALTLSPGRERDRGVRHGAPRRTRFRNPLDFTWISDFRMDFWISKWISGFQSGFLDFKVDFWISSGFLDFKVDFWISKWISGFQADFWISFEPLNNHEPHSSQPIC